MENIIDIFKNKNCTLLSEGVKLLTEKVEYRCNVHPDSIYTDSPSNFKRKKYGCPICTKEGRAKSRRRHTIEDIKKEFENVGYTLISKEFINIDSHLEYMCNKHPESIKKITYSKFRHGRRCKKCWDERRLVYFDDNRHSFEYVKELFEQRGYILLETEYLNNKQKLKYRCPNHPDSIRKISLDKLLMGRGCIECGRLKLSEINRLDLEIVKKMFSAVGLSIVGEYKGANIKVETICEKGHKNMSYLSAARNGHGCKECSVLARTGENGSAWKGGVTPLTRRLRADMDVWKFDILENYDFTCQITGKRGGNLHVHHLTPFHLLRDSVLNELGFNNAKFLADISYLDYVKIRDLLFIKHKNEGIPIAQELHELFHKTYGRYNFTKEDFYEFKTNYLLGKYTTEGA
mgnify:CR=1 FL=1